MPKYGYPSIAVEEKKSPKGQVYTVVVFKGDLDKDGLENVRGSIDEVVENLKSDMLVFNFTQLNFVNSESIGFILTVHYRLLKKQKKLMLVGANEHVKDVLDVIGLNKIISHFGSMSEFEVFLT